MYKNMPWPRGKTWENFSALIEQDQFIAKHLSTKDIANCFNPKAYVRHQQQIFKRVFGNVKKTKRARSSPKKSIQAKPSSKG